MLKKSQGPVLPPWKYSIISKKLHIRKYCLDARKGKLPIFYYSGIAGAESNLVSDLLALAFLENGSLTELDLMKT